jgi:hypothetical protein
MNMGECPTRAVSTAPRTPGETLQLLNARLFALLLIAACVTLAGCARIEQKERQIHLDKAVRLYVESIRWGNFDTAAGFIRPREGTSHALNTRNLGDVRVTAYSSRILHVDETIHEAQVAVAFDYYNVNSGTLRSVSQTLLWWFDPVTESWYLDGTLPNFSR